MLSPLANFNGVELPLADVRVSALDRGYLLGDGVYEVIRVYNAKPWLFDEHMERLARSLGELRIACDVERIATTLEATLTNSGVTEGILYAQVTRGVAPRSHRFPIEPVQPSVLVYAQETGDVYAASRNAGVAAITQADMRWRRCDVKSINLLGNVLANQAATEAGAFEAILLNERRELTEGTHTSVFVVTHGKLVTAPDGNDVLPGITRDFLLTLADELGYEVERRRPSEAELRQADEIFLTGTTTEVMPVVTLDGKTVGGGRPGPVAATILDAYRTRVKNWAG